VIRGNPDYGILAFEVPIPFPPTSKTLYFGGIELMHDRGQATGTFHVAIAPASTSAR